MLLIAQHVPTPQQHQRPAGLDSKSCLAQYKLMQDFGHAHPALTSERVRVMTGTAGSVLRVQLHCCRLLIPALDAHQADAVAQHVPSPQQHQQPAALDTRDFTAKELDKLLRQRQERARQFGKQQQQVNTVCPGCVFASATI